MGQIAESPRGKALRAAADKVREAIEGSRGLDATIAEALGNMSFIEALEEAPRYSSSLDVARSLVPPDWFWRCGRTVLYDGWAFISKTHGDHCQPEEDEFGASKDYWRGKWTPELALCNASLRARAWLADVHYDREQRRAAHGAKGEGV